MIKKIVLPSFFVYWLILALSPLPIFYFAMHYTMTLGQLADLDERIEMIRAKKEQSEAVQRRQYSVLSSLSQSDPYYIDKHLESLTFLESEVKKMQMFCADAPVDEAFQKRLYFLREGPNRLLFSEEKTRSNDKMREVFEKQQNPVELNEEDLKKLLCLVEGSTIWPYGPKEGRPQLVIQDFHLSKKRYTPHDHVFVVNMNIIKWENNTLKEGT